MFSIEKQKEITNFLFWNLMKIYILIYSNIFFYMFYVMFFFNKKKKKKKKKKRRFLI